jgi:hypothetical protein
LGEKLGKDSSRKQRTKDSNLIKRGKKTKIIETKKKKKNPKINNTARAKW